jgi:epoxide hydrolase 4
MTAFQDRLIKTNGITLHALTAGPEDGPLVLMLHGFPEFSYGWHNQIPVLAEAGYFVVAPDQRGYNLSDKPEGVHRYKIENMVADAAGMIKVLGREKAFVIGHDWGGNVAWWLALTHPEMVEKLVIMNVPHPKVFVKMIRSNIRQLFKSWYIFAVQIPRLPEAMLLRNNAADIERAFLDSAKKATFSTGDIEKYREAWLCPGAMTAMLNWYRAALRHPPDDPASWRVTVPTLMLWGKQDVALDEAMAQPSIELCDDGQLVMYEDATHWVQHDAADRVNAELLAFLGER